MRQLIYTDQSADELRLNLVQGAVNKEKLTILCTGTIHLPFKNGSKLEVGIIGASHYIEIVDFNGRVLLTEVFACVECVELKHGNRLLTANLHNAGFVAMEIDGLNYQFNSHKSSWSKSVNDFFQLSGLIKSNLTNHQLGLIYTFPRGTNDKFSPTTLVFAGLNKNEGELNIKSIHAYPNENSLVFTNTIITQRTGGIK